MKLAARHRAASFFGMTLLTRGQVESLLKWTPPAGPLGPASWLEVRPFLAPQSMKLLSAAVGKASPVHFFWGSFDLAVTRFSANAGGEPRA